MTQAAQAPATLVVERAFAHPPQKLWRALTEGELLAQWLLANDFQAQVGHRFTFRAEPNPHWDGLVPGEVLVVEPPSKLSYSWLHWVVTWTLTPTAEGTTLRMEQAGFAPDQVPAYQGAKYGWTNWLANLEGCLGQLA